MMYANAWPFEGASHAPTTERQRAVGRVVFSAEQLEGITRPLRISESGSLRIRLPRGEGRGIDAVLRQHCRRHCLRRSVRDRNRCPIRHLHHGRNARLREGLPFRWASRDVGCAPDRGGWRSPRLAAARDHPVRPRAFDAQPRRRNGRERDTEYFSRLWSSDEPRDRKQSQKVTSPIDGGSGGAIV